MYHISTIKICVSGIMPHCITSDTMEGPFRTIFFDGKNYEAEMKDKKYTEVQTFSR